MKTTAFLGGLALSTVSRACLLPEERDGHADLRRVVRRQGNNGAPVGTGDRFSNSVPQGLGTQDTSFETLLNTDEIKSGLDALSAEYGIDVFETPYTTYEGATIYGATVGGSGSGSCTDKYRVFFNGNIHARERGSMDNILYFISDLLYADKNDVGVTWGDATYTAEQVKTALSAGIVFIPLSNPDGVAYDQANNNCWRKNRNLDQGVAAAAGVDLNRNFDFLWDFTEVFAQSVVNSGSLASESPASGIYHGSAPLSEPETQSIEWVFDTYSKVRWFIDLHSYAGDVLYSWGVDTNQVDYDYMGFANATYDDVRGDMTDTPGRGDGYGEYTPQEELDANVEAAERMGAAMELGGGRAYNVMQSADLYPTSGASDDWAYSRHFSDSSKNLVHGYTIEFGFGNNAASCPFYPTVEQMNDNIKATNAGFMEFLLAAVELGLGDETTC